jgi:hypothetical protein
MMSDLSQPNDNPAVPDATIASIVDALRGLRFGSVVVTVQDGVVVQIDRTEKRRLSASSSSSPTSRSC